jgi:hypothetical protein
MDPSPVITRTHQSDFRQRQLIITRDDERLGTFDVKPAV